MICSGTAVGVTHLKQASDKLSKPQTAEHLFEVLSCPKYINILVLLSMIYLLKKLKLVAQNTIELFM